MPLYPDPDPRPDDEDGRAARRRRAPRQAERVDIHGLVRRLGVPHAAALAGVRATGLQGRVVDGVRLWTAGEAAAIRAALAERLQALIPQVIRENGGRILEDEVAAEVWRRLQAAWN